MKVGDEKQAKAEEAARDAALRARQEARMAQVAARLRACPYGRAGRK